MLKGFVKAGPDLWSCGGVPVSLPVGSDTKLFTSNHILVIVTAVKDECWNSYRGGIETEVVLNSSSKRNTELKIIPCRGNTELQFLDEELWDIESQEATGLLEDELKQLRSCPAFIAICRFVWSTYLTQSLMSVVDQSTEMGILFKIPLRLVCRNYLMPVS